MSVKDRARDVLRLTYKNQYYHAVMSFDFDIYFKRFYSYGLNELKHEVAFKLLFI